MTGHQAPEYGLIINVPKVKHTVEQPPNNKVSATVKVRARRLTGSN